MRFDSWTAAADVSTMKLIVQIPSFALGAEYAIGVQKKCEADKYNVDIDDYRGFILFPRIKVSLF